MVSFSAAYLSVFFVILVGSRFFNLLNPKGQIIIVSISVLLKNAMLLFLLRIFSQDIVYSKRISVWFPLFSIGVTGLIRATFFSIVQTTCEGFPAEWLKGVRRMRIECMTLCFTNELTKIVCRSRCRRNVIMLKNKGEGQLP